MIIQADGHAGGWTLGESEPKEKRGGILDKRRGNKAKQKKKNTKLSMERMEDQELMTTIESRDFQILSLTQPSNPPATKIS